MLQQVLCLFNITVGTFGGNGNVSICGFQTQRTWSCESFFLPGHESNCLLGVDNCCRGHSENTLLISCLWSISVLWKHLLLQLTFWLTHLSSRDSREGFCNMTRVHWWSLTPSVFVWISGYFGQQTHSQLVDLKLLYMQIWLGSD